MLLQSSHSAPNLNYKSGYVLGYGCFDLFIFQCILTLFFQAAAWSCSWDLNNAHHVYAGLQVCLLLFFPLFCQHTSVHRQITLLSILQNGMLLVFDMRQTLKPMESLEGLSCNPIHSMHSLLHKETHGARTILSASSIGLCQWKIDSGEERLVMVDFIIF